MESEMRGAMIVGMGLPGSGKSSIFAALNDLMQRRGIESALFREPEESEWPAAVKERDAVGHITALTWFRAQRVPGLYQASHKRASGTIALVDSYYDKLVSSYFDHPGFEWLMRSDDPYREAYRQIIELDYAYLPDADCVVTLTVAKDRWHRLVTSRGRALDRSSNLIEKHYTQNAYITAAETYCNTRGIPHIQFENVQETAAESAMGILELLTQTGLLK